MKAVHPLPPRELLHALFDYSVVEGALYWRQRPSRNVDIRKPAGGLSGSGYHYIKIQSKTYRRSRLVWAFNYGDPCSLELDHINRVRDDDRIENLRLATPAENGRSRSLNSNNTSGYRGVSWNIGVRKYAARIRNTQGRLVHLGYFFDPEDAAAAYAEAARKYHGEFIGQLTR